MASPAAQKCLVNEVDLLRGVVNNLVLGVAVCDERGKLIFFNREAERILGLGLQEIGIPDWTPAYGCYFADRVTPYPAEQLPLARAIRGTEISHELIFIRNASQPHGLWISVTGKPLKDDSGAIRGGVALFRDLTEAETALGNNGGHAPAPQAAPPVEIGPDWEVYLERLRGFRQYCDRLSRAVEQTADTVIITDARGAIEYVNPAFEATTGYSAAEVLGRNPRLLKSGHHDDQFYKDLWRQVLSGKPFRGTIINRRKSGELYWAQQTITPIRNERKEITHFVSLMKDVSELRKQQEQEFHMRLAQEVQQRFYSTSVSLPGFDIAGAAYPAALTGGDYFDFIRQPDGCIYIAIGDVSGHGFGAALMMATTRAYLRAFAKSESDVGSILTSVNAALAADVGGHQFITLLLIRLDSRHGSMEYAGAGHVPGYLLDTAGDTRLVLESFGPPCGVFADQVYSSSPAVRLRDGETIVLATDGVSETISGDGIEYGMDRMLELVRSRRNAPAQEMVRAIYESARSYAGVEAQHDDLTAVICNVRTS